MKNTALVLLLTATIASSCSSGIAHIFDKKTPHEKYAEKVEDKYENTPEGRQWLAASGMALKNPQTVSLPYALYGYFQSDKPRALGLQFHAKAGEQLQFTVDQKPGSRFTLFAELFKQNGGEPSLVLSVDTASSQFNVDVAETGDYILRLQPEMYRSGGYNLSVAVGPSLGFPVSGKKAEVGSVWGDNRDGGKRNHEGIDIFAPKLTPAIAAADGYITTVKEGGLGGKVVFLRPEGKDYTLYYAHLDKQLVHEGQQVKKGDVVGLVGNTGNAKHTPSHLHFGVYTNNGAIDPLPFVNRTVKKASDVSAKNLATYLKLTKAQKAVDGTSIKANTIVVPVAVDAKGYIVELPDGKMMQAGFGAVQVVKQTGNVASLR
jgi:murein DD-endopeptidase MepM/ murein hydrolase activator NlpD